MKKTYIGIVLIVLSIAALVFWEGWGREKLMFTEVLTVSQNVEENTVITKDMLAVKKVNAASDASYRVNDVNLVVGKTATQFIPLGAELYPSFFEEDQLIVHEDKGEYVFSVPNSWLMSYPQTLRRGDVVTFTVGGAEITSATVLYVKDSSNTEVTSDEERLSGSSNVSLVEVIVDKTQFESLAYYAAQGERFVLIYR